MNAQSLRKWSLANLMNILWLSVIMLLGIWCQNAIAIQIKTKLNLEIKEKITTTVSPNIAIDNNYKMFYINNNNYTTSLNNKSHDITYLLSNNNKNINNNNNTALNLSALNVLNVPNKRSQHYDLINKTRKNSSANIVIPIINYNNKIYSRHIRETKNNIIYNNNNSQQNLESIPIKHERYERIALLNNNNNYNNNNNNNNNSYKEEQLNHSIPLKQKIEENEWILQHKEKQLRIQSHRRHLIRLHQLIPINNTLIIKKDEHILNKININNIMMARNRRDSKLIKNKRKRQRRYCSARDPTQLAFEAPTVFEGKLRSMSSDRRTNFSVTFEVKEIFKKQLGYKLPHLLRLQFTYRNTSNECDIYREYLRKRGLIRDELEQGRIYILFVQQIDLGNFTILGQPVKKTRRAINSVRIGVSENYAQAASVKSITSAKQSLQNGDTLRIVCKVRGQPPPKVTWFKDDRSINRNRKLYQFLHLKKRSELIIRSFRTADAGLYECRAKNKVTRKPDRKSIRIEASQKPRRNEEGFSHSSGDECPDAMQSYCLNGATCKYFREIVSLSCTCPDGFDGDRCQEKKPTNLEPSPTYKSGYMADEPLPNSNEDDDNDDESSETEDLPLLFLDNISSNKFI